MASVTLEKVRKDYGAVRVLHAVDLEIADGEFVVLVGPSGCGKSTLLRMIAGLEEASGGEIRIGERLVNDVAPKDRDIAMVFQSYALYPHMDVSKNMGFSLLLKKAQKSTIDARVDGAAKRLGLDTFLQRLPRQLSGGQRQRVAMGRAIVRDPKVFLFDEPLSNLDAKLRVHMRAEIKALHQQLKTTSVYVTHDQIEAMTMADRIVVMHDGLIQQVGAPLDLYDRPANMFVAGFIGSPGMNFLPATVEKAGKVDAVLSDGQKLRLPDGLPLKDGDAITIGLRPEHIRLADDGALRGEVVVVEPLGLSTQFYVKLANQQLCVFAMGRAGVKPGDTVRLAADPAALHLFDPKSGDRIG
ncbi:glycerol-3-phosphate ABC transporter ATP-binding protein [Mesorhizobium sp. SEMIA 3007]|uniref:Sn-glycerol-3-phosphate ABC transporter ATP-binding protein UgpC n=1 Tax=Mesorhizobium jarvisii TaxID=1777867 RepID=A0A6M7TKD4_9HYPH|nr:MULTISPECIES: sn-glycerol-3-phosphate ABC transporter ATP-binding protein UgpC [Mesorhizobium]AID30338.1 sn-glycerol-3-phosphate ABC transporter ATP-binding protein UgpC [Mesorhizobium huakuii 7653R]ANN59065.1 glycerol-3-phosphate ABC transporter ATP-binding protein [Mesorhizobium loti NZP2037]MCH4560153.1 sn-glycerol-3-phosphate ABC transporter ATP-binding protein UgpC [Mesorhizobium jarvisii]OBQ64398.1 glycerol-3-phosphate ABC transporter ATP-binding protein [Mesorhizobium loti]ODA95399.1